MASTKQKDNNPLLTRRTALTTPSGALLRNGRFSELSPVLRAFSGRVVASI